MARPRGSKNKVKEQAPAPGDSPASPEITAATEPPKQEDLPPPGEPHFKSRLSLLNEIGDANRERLEEDEASGEDPDAGDEPPPDEETPPPAVVEPEPEKPVVAKRKLTIDGVEKEYSEDQIIALAQKNGSADSRLAEATRILEDARRNTATRQGAGDPATPADVGQNRQPPDSEGVDDDVVQQVTDALLFGDRDKVAESISKLLSQGRQPATPAFNPQDIRATVSETIAFERAKTALETPADQGGFADVWTDPMLRAMFERREAELRDGNPSNGTPKDQRPYLELYTSIATELRQWRDDLVKKHSTTGLENRDHSKRLAAVVRGGGGKPPATNAPIPVLSHDEKIEAMKRARGLN